MIFQVFTELELANILFEVGPDFNDRDIVTVQVREA